MNERLEKMEMALSNAGLEQNAIEKAKRLLAAGHTEDLIRYLRLCRCDLMDELHLCRCDLMDELHKTQRRVDCMDYVIRQTEKNICSEITKGRQES